MYYVHNKRHTKDESNKLGNVHMMSYLWNAYPELLDVYFKKLKMRVFEI